MRKSLAGLRHFLSTRQPAKLVLAGYASYVLLGWALLCTPWAQAKTGVAALDNLFVATSALSTTGLVTVSVSDDYSLMGQIVVLALIQLGGVGYMTCSSFVILCRRQPLSEAREGIAKAVFSLPASFRIDKFIRSVIIFTLLVESVGAVALYAVFYRAGVPAPAWSAVFHSVSAFCTAGFSLYNSSFEAFAGDFWLHAIVAALSCTGAVGFIVCVDAWRKLTGRVAHVTLTTKIILHATLWILLAGTLAFFFTEPSVRQMPLDQRLMASFFQAMAAMTTVGFNTVPIGALSRAALLLVTILMVIGASPSGTGGGLKSTTVAVIYGIMRSALRGHSEVRFWGHRIPEERVWAAVASLGLYLSFLLLGTYLLTMTEAASFENILFEAASALGTVGLSTGITPQLTDIGKVIVTFLMFVGRLGPLTFGLALFLPAGVFGQRDSDVAI
jgi:trk system potassium uptake protein TrkH